VYLKLLVKVRLLLPPEQTHGLGQLVEILCAALQVLGPPHGLEVQQDDPQALVPEPDQQEPDLHPQDPALHEGIQYREPSRDSSSGCDAMLWHATPSAPIASSAPVCWRSVAFSPFVVRR
jgi:hypothetical protein